mmetsp:Transcript_27930/g.83460  ORF Transcript_27930/g.83460 Transcript_27930/m.83460 type:complete len:400 (+) Transcript_27930:221-1420(+)
MDGPQAKVFGLEMLLEHIVAFLRAPRDLLAASQVCSIWRVASHRVEARRASAVALWPAQVFAIGPDDEAAPVARKVARGQLVGDRVAAWINESATIPKACIVYALVNMATKDGHAAQESFASALEAALPPTCKISCCYADGICGNDVEVFAEPHGIAPFGGASVMLVPRTASIEVSVAALDTEFVGEDGELVYEDEIEDALEGLRSRFFTSGLTALMVSPLMEGYAMYEMCQKWFNELEVPPPLQLFGGLTGAKTVAPFFYRDGSTTKFCDGILMLSMVPADGGQEAAACAAFSADCPLNADTLLHHLHTDRPLRAGGVHGALMFSCIGRYGWEEPELMRKAIRNVPLVGFFAVGELGQGSHICRPPGARIGAHGGRDILRMCSYTNCTAFLGKRAAAP